MDDRSAARFLRWLGLSANRRAGLGGVAAGLLGLGLGDGAAGAEADTQRCRKRGKRVKVSGTETFNATPEEVWAFVTNAETGASCSAAVEEITSQSGNTFTVKVGYKKGSFNPSGTVDGTFSNMIRGKSGRLSGTGKANAGGRLEHNLEFSLRPVQGGMATETTFVADLVFSGMLGCFPQKFLKKQVDTVASKFVECARQKNGW